MVLSLVVVLAAAFALTAGHVLHGGFYWDDWQFAAATRYPTHGGLLPGTPTEVETFRPLWAWWTAILFGVVGTHYAFGLGLAVVLGAMTAVCVYVLLRVLGLAWVHAGAIAALTLFFPFASSTHLYLTNADNNVPASIFLVGVILVVWGLRGEGRRAAALTALSVACYLLSVVMYEVAATAALVTVVFYLAAGVPWRRALARWALDVVLVGAAGAIVAAQSPHASHSLRVILGHARIIVTQAGEVLSRAMTGWPGVPTAIGAALLIGVAAAAGVATVRLRASDSRVTELRRWLLVLGAALVMLAGCYAVFAPAEVRYSPLATGTGDRVNILAAPAYATVVYAICMLAGVLLVGRRSRALRAGVPLVVALIVLGGYVQRYLDVQGDWNASHSQQQRVIRAVEAAIAHPPPSATIYTFGSPTYVSPGIPVFAARWDLRGALRIALHRPRLRAFPIRQITRDWSCRRQWMNPVGDPRSHAPYGAAYFVNTATGQATPIRSQAECVKQAPRFLAARPSPAGRS